MYDFFTLATTQLQDEYTKKYNGLLARHEKATVQGKEHIAEKVCKQNRERGIQLFIKFLKKQPAFSKWNNALWVTLIDRATVFRDHRAVFRFKSGSEIEVTH